MSLDFLRIIGTAYDVRNISKDAHAAYKEKKWVRFSLLLFYLISLICFNFFVTPYAIANAALWFAGASGVALTGISLFLTIATGVVIWMVKKYLVKKINLIDF